MNCFSYEFYLTISISKVDRILEKCGWKLNTLYPSGNMKEYTWEHPDYPIKRILVPVSEQLLDYPIRVKEVFESLAIEHNIPFSVLVAYTMKEDKEEAWLYATDDMDMIIRPVKKLEEYLKKDPISACNCVHC